MATLLSKGVSNQLISLASRENDRYGRDSDDAVHVSNQLISLASREGICQVPRMYMWFATCFQSINFPSE